MSRTKKDMITIHKNDIKEVENFEGKLVPREDCKRIDGKYYQVNVDCFLIPNEKGELKWTRKNTGRIAFDYDMQKWDLTKRLREKEEYVEGIIDEKGNKGYFTLNPYVNVTITENANDDSSGGTICVNSTVAEKLGYSEYYGTGCYINTAPLSASGKKSLKKIDIYRYPKLKKLAYNADDDNNHYLKIIAEYNKHKSKMPISPSTMQAAKLFGNYSFGIEAESCNGFIPPNLLGPLGIVPLKDGSLRDGDREPYEYTTIPLSGELGLETVKLQFEELNKRCEINKQCSLHIHIGSIPKRSMEFVIALYKLCYKIQDEVFEMFPAYKTNPENFGFHKNYCHKLPNLNLDEEKFNTANLKPQDAKILVKSAFDKIYHFWSDNTVRYTDGIWNLDNRQHPKGKLNKWDYQSRYSWCNMHNFLFSHRSTIEWRCHTPTMNFIKTSNWLFITTAIVQFAEQFTNEILKDDVEYTLENILGCYRNYFFKSFYENDYSNQVADYLIDYVRFRKQMMKKDIENGDGFGTSIEFKKDSKFEFESHGLKSLY